MIRCNFLINIHFLISIDFEDLQDSFSLSTTTFKNLQKDRENPFKLKTSPRIFAITFFKIKAQTLLYQVPFFKIDANFLFYHAFFDHFHTRTFKNLKIKIIFILFRSRVAFYTSDRRRTFLFFQSKTTQLSPKSITTPTHTPTPLITL